MALRPCARAHDLRTARRGDEQMRDHVAEMTRAPGDPGTLRSVRQQGGSASAPQVRWNGILPVNARYIPA